MKDGVSNNLAVANRRPKDLRRVISVCEAKDIDAWRAASPRIVKYIESVEYHLICPDAQVSDFIKASHPAWEIIGESRFTRDWGHDEIRQQVRGENVFRVGWLLQQFIKINAIIHSDLDDGDPVLIWDADTVPLAEIRFVDPASGIIRFYHSRERHEPYFKTINCLLGSGALADKSFIAQCLPVRVGWVRGLVREIERGDEGSCIGKVLESLPGESGSEFSEYETIGTWAFRHHRGEMEFDRRNRWLRSGSSIISGDLLNVRSRLVLDVLSVVYDFVAFERWKRKLDFGTVCRAVRTRFSKWATRARG